MQVGDWVQYKGCYSIQYGAIGYIETIGPAKVADMWSAKATVHVIWKFMPTGYHLKETYEVPENLVVATYANETTP